MKKYIFLLILSIITITLQQAIFSKISIFGAGVSIVFVFIVCFSILGDELDCIIVALFCGIITDAFFPYIFGINTVVYLLFAYLLVQIEKRIYKDVILIPMLLTFGASVLKNILFYVYLYIASIRINFNDFTFSMLILEPLYNSILSLLIYKLVRRISNMRLMHDEWKF